MLRAVSREEIASAVFRPGDVVKVQMLHPSVRWRCVDHLRLAREAKVPFVIVYSFRTFAEQRALYLKGRDPVTLSVVNRSLVVTWAPAGRSWHQYSLAYDVALLNPDGKSVHWKLGADYDRDGRPDWTEVGEAGEALGLTWGARWPGKKTDAAHFEYHPGLSLTAAWNMTVGAKALPDEFFEKVA